MKHVKKSVLLWYSAAEMYALVIAVEDYPAFLPWCERARVLERDAEGLTAQLDLAYAGVRHAFTTRNMHTPERSVHIGLVDGPFSLLDGTWRFTALAPPGLGGSAAPSAALSAATSVSTPPSAASDPAKACKIDFELRYAFSNGPLEALISPVFDRIANTFVDAFVRRAEQVYGAR